MLRGIDACNSEIGCRPEIFAPSFRLLTTLSYAPTRPIPAALNQILQLKATYHAGEDFHDIADGLRTIDEAVLFCGLHRGDRIGHALALGVDPTAYAQMKASSIALPKQEALDNFAWMIMRSAELGVTLPGSLRQWLENQFYDLLSEIYSPLSDVNSVNIQDYYHAWLLRGDHPLNYARIELPQNDPPRPTELLALHQYDTYMQNPSERVLRFVRRRQIVRTLIHSYLYNRQVNHKGAEPWLLKITPEYSSTLDQIQARMRDSLAQAGIFIECNPSSNVLIGPIEKYRSHPVFAFNSQGISGMSQNSQPLCVSINTDDQGVFDTSLENEYALMALALEKHRDQEGNLMYNVHEIYQWLDDVRNMGLQQSFGNLPNNQ